MINKIQSSYGFANTYQTRGREMLANQTEPSKNVSDSVNLSDKGDLLSSFFASINVPYTPGQPISLDDLKTGLLISEKNYRAEVDRLFSQNAISTPPPVSLSSNGAGKIIVTDDHPQKQEIEQLFQDNPQLGNTFRGVSALSSFLKAVERHEKFAHDYAIDPEAAVDKYSQLFNNSNEERFIMKFG